MKGVIEIPRTLRVIKKPRTNITPLRIPYTSPVAGIGRFDLCIKLLNIFPERFAAAMWI